MIANPTSGFGDNVRVIAAPMTDKKGLSGLIGQVYGETTPSVTNVEVIGQLETDCAVNVFFQERNESYWFAAGLIEFVDHAPGTKIAIDDRTWVRADNGEWKATGKKTGLS